jgi:hypothetical protein
MKWIVLVLFTLAICGANTIEIVRETNSEIELIFHLQQYQSQLVEHQNKFYERFDSPESNYHLKEGYPIYSYYTADFIIPDHDKMTLELGEINYEEIKVSKIVPAGYEDYEKPLFFADVYQQDEWYPLSWAELGNPYIFRDLRGITITFNPFRYNPVQGIVQIASSIRLKIKSIGISEKNTLLFKQHQLTYDFHLLYQKHFLNYDDSLFELEKESEINIICHERFSESIEPLVRWKNQMGWKVNLFYYPAFTGSHWQDIHLFLKRQYETTNFSYLFIIGSEDHIPIPEPIGFSSQSDKHYSFINGDDNFSDILVGRLPVSNEKELGNWIQNIIRYEKNPLSLQPELSGLLIADLSNEKFVLPSRRPATFLQYNYLSQVATMDYLSAGLYWFLHSNDFIFSDYNWENLRLHLSSPFILSLSNQMEWEKQPPYQFLHLQENQTDGIIAHIQINNTHEFTTYQQLKKAFSSLEGNAYLTAGMLLQEVLLSRVSSSNNQKSSTDYVLYGDPTLLLNTQPPGDLYVQHQRTLQSSAKKISFTVQNKVGAVSGANVALSQDGILLQSARSDRFGKVSFELTSEFEERRLIDVVISYRNHIPYLGSVHFAGEDDETISIPLLQAEIFPNPYYSEGIHRSSQSTLFYELNERSKVKISIYNSLGQLVKGVFDGDQAEGQYSFLWDGSDELGRKVATGTYFFLIEVNHRTISKKMLVIK